MRRTIYMGNWSDRLAERIANEEALQRAEQAEREQRQRQAQQSRELVHSAPWNPEDCQ